MFGSHVIETRGEVGLLSHNVKVQGVVNQEFVYTIPACDRPFDSGENKI